jgi:hypothetical protein
MRHSENSHFVDGADVGFLLLDRVRAEMLRRVVHRSPDRFDAMRPFLRVVERRGFTQAANDNGLRRSTATQVISQLERRLGARLLERTTGAHRAYFLSRFPSCSVFIRRLKGFHFRLRAGHRTSSSSLIGYATRKFICVSRRERGAKLTEMENVKGKREIHYRHGFLAGHRRRNRGAARSRRLRGRDQLCRRRGRS